MFTNLFKKGMLSFHISEEVRVLLTKMVMAGREQANNARPGHQLFRVFFLIAPCRKIVTPYIYTATTFRFCGLSHLTTFRQNLYIYRFM